jgi:hypothetical protein
MAAPPPQEVQPATSQVSQFSGQKEISQVSFQPAEAASKYQVRNFFAYNKINNLQASF